MPPNQDDRIGVPKEELEFEPVEVQAPKRHWGRWLSVLIILIVGAGAGWFYLGDRLTTGDQKGVPVVRADVAPVKIKPADPGGLDVPDRDKLVYDRLNGEGGSSEVESLLPPPEEPMELPDSQPVGESVSESEGATETTEETMAPTTLEPLVEAPVALEPTPVPEVPADSATIAPETTETSEAPPPPPVPVEAVDAAELAAPPTPEPMPEPEPAAAPESETVAVASNSSGFRIQLAALRTHSSAEAEWKRLKNTHPGILGPMALFVVKVDLGGDQGIYYRLRAGNMATKETAKAVCDKLAARNVACLVIRPGK
ncbi:MAG: SPOR domain-containing protein [Rhodospirillales bacterium]|nr:SPOR domain-containing protein [Rhodospirillales bacterium]